MNQIPLKTQPRLDRGTTQTRLLRQKGFIPAEVYGKKEANYSVLISQKEFQKILSTHSGENLFFLLEIQGKTTPTLAVVKEIQYHPISHDILHTDFHVIKMDEKIKVKIPIRILNAEICSGVKEGGVLEIFLRNIEVTCLPKEIPNGITVDVKNLIIGQSIHVSDLQVPEGIKMLQETNRVVVTVAAHQEEAAAEAVAAPAEPEVLTAKKTEAAPGTPTGPADDKSKDKAAAAPSKK
jgi:large subunit ribosomal protein L25